MCGWAETGQASWEIGRSTPTAYTGPLAPPYSSSDSTFLYLESSGGVPGDTSYLRSPNFTYTAAAMQFYWHATGGDVGTFAVEAAVAGAWESVFTIVGEQHTAQAANWSLQLVNLPAGAEAVRLQGVRGSGDRGDISIDTVGILTAAHDVCSCPGGMPAIGAAMGCPVAGQPRCSRCDVGYSLCDDIASDAPCAAVGAPDEYRYSANPSAVQCVVSNSSTGFESATLGEWWSATGDYWDTPTTAGDTSPTANTGPSSAYGGSNFFAFLEADSGNPGHDSYLESLTFMPFSAATPHAIIAQDASSHKCVSQASNFHFVCCNATGRRPSRSRSYVYDYDFDSGSGSDFGNGWTESGTWWTRGSSTPSSLTGPTSGDGGSSHFAFLEASSSSSGATSYLVSPALTGQSSVSFAYHMFGADMGSLSLEISVGGAWTTAFSRTGNQTSNQNSPWTAANVTLPVGTDRVRFKGVRGSSWAGDMAVDSVQFSGMQSGNWTFATDTCAGISAHANTWLCTQAEVEAMANVSSLLWTQDTCNTSTSSMSFKYHMFGDGIGSLTVQAAVPVTQRLDPNTACPSSSLSAAGDLCCVDSCGANCGTQHCALQSAGAAGCCGDDGTGVGIVPTGKACEATGSVNAPCMLPEILDEGWTDIWSRSGEQHAAATDAWSAAAVNFPAGATQVRFKGSRSQQVNAVIDTTLGDISIDDVTFSDSPTSICSCAHGIPMVEDNCPVHGHSKCQSCDPGFVLQTGTCNYTVQSSPCSFEGESMCGWSRGQYWKRGSATSTANTGPAAAYAGSAFMYVESAASSTMSQASYLTSPTFTDVGLLKSMAFYYFMFGDDTGTLRVDAQTSLGTWLAQWTKHGEQHAAQTDSWTAATINLVSGVTRVRFAVIELHLPSAPYGDIAVDDVRFHDTEQNTCDCNYGFNVFSDTCQEGSASCTLCTVESQCGQSSLCDGTWSPCDQTTCTQTFLSGSSVGSCPVTHGTVQSCRDGVCAMGNESINLGACSPVSPCRPGHYCSIGKRNSIPGHIVPGGGDTGYCVLCAPGVCGCLDPLASNYDFTVSHDDGSCVYDDSLCGINVTGATRRLQAALGSGSGSWAIELGLDASGGAGGGGGANSELTWRSRVKVGVSNLTRFVKLASASAPGSMTHPWRVYEFVCTDMLGKRLPLSVHSSSLSNRLYGPELAVDQKMSTMWSGVGCTGTCIANGGQWIVFDLGKTVDTFTCQMNQHPSDPRYVVRSVSMEQTGPFGIPSSVGTRPDQRTIWSSPEFYTVVRGQNILASRGASPPHEQCLNVSIPPACQNVTECPQSDYAIGSQLFVAGTTKIIRFTRFHVHSRSTADLQGNGGAIFAADSLVSISKSIFDENNAILGGGLYVLNCSIALSHSRFSTNVAALEGGAAYVSRYSEMVVRATQFGHNRATRGGAGFMIKDSVVNFTRSTFVGNRIVQVTSYANLQSTGAGIFGSNARIAIEFSSFTANSGGGHSKAGGVYTSVSWLTVLDTNFDNNSATTSGRSMGAHVWASAMHLVYIYETRFLPFTDGGGSSINIGGVAAACDAHPCALGDFCTYTAYSLSCAKCPPIQVGLDGRVCSSCPSGQGPLPNQTACAMCSQPELQCPECYSTFGTCYSCGDGYVANADQTGCDDVNECLVNHGGCDPMMVSEAFLFRGGPF
jgi:hypothetical protein